MTDYIYVRADSGDNLSPFSSYIHRNRFTRSEWIFDLIVLVVCCCAIDNLCALAMKRQRGIIKRPLNIFMHMQMRIVTKRDINECGIKYSCIIEINYSAHLNA